MKRVLKDRGWSDASAQRVRTLIDAEVGQEVQHGSKRVVRDRHSLTTALRRSQAEVRIDLETGARPCDHSGRHMHVDGLPMPRFHCRAQRRPCLDPFPLSPSETAGLESRRQDSTAWHGWSHEGERRADPSEGPSTLKGHALVLERLSDGHVLWVVGHKLAEEARINVTTFADTQGVELTYKPSQQP